MEQEIVHLIIFLSTICLISCILNGFSLYNVLIIKRKNSADCIRGQIFLMNLVFTSIAIPYYITKEARLLNAFSCKFFYFVTDLIMFVYNSLLILMAIDRFLLICTQIRIKIGKMLKIFYLIVIVISMPSLLRLIANDCSNNVNLVGLKSVFSLEPLLNETNGSVLSNYRDYMLRKNIIILYNYYIVVNININWCVTVALYLVIIRYVYKNSILKSSRSSYFLKYRSSSKRPKKREPVVVVVQKNKDDAKEIGNNFLKEPTTGEKGSSQYSIATNSSMYRNTSRMVNTRYSKKYKSFERSIKISKHWRIAKTFIKVVLNFIPVSNLF